MKEIRLEARLRNNRLWHAIFDHWPNVSKFCEAFGLSNFAVGELLNLTAPPRNKKGEWRPITTRLEELLKIPKEELFPLRLYSLPMTKTNQEIPLTALPAAPKTLCFPGTEETPETVLIQKERKLEIQRILRTLTAREQTVLMARFGLNDEGDATHQEIGDRLGVHRERIRQIETKALRKLRHPTRAYRLRTFLAEWEPSRRERPMRFRPNRGTITESLEASRECAPTLKALAGLIECRPEQVTVEFYCQDDRGGQFYWIVRVDGRAVGFINHDLVAQPQGEP